ncbi:MAG: hypothetical protein WC292_06585 [Clostridia bacterium]
MNKKVFIIIVAALLAMAVLAGCTESYKTQPIPTDFSDLTVTSNGGLAVRVGKYLYYINGYAGNEVNNVFGEVYKGAIARVELDADGIPQDSTNMIVVAKNVYNTVSTSGLYVVKDYIYYSTPSIEKNSRGEPKINEMHIMRTKLDGTDTQTVAKFKDYTPIYKVVDGYLLYVNSESELHEIDLNSKKFDDKLVTDEVAAHHMTEYKNNSNSFVDAVFYTKADEDKSKTNNVIWAYRAGGEAKKVIEGNKNSYGDSLEHAGGYTLTLVASQYMGDGLRLVYDKTDGGSQMSQGTYSYDFTSSLGFDRTQEVRYGWAKTFSSLTFLNQEKVIALSGNNVVLLTVQEDGRWLEKNLIEQSAAPTIFDVVISQEKVTVYFISSSILYRMDVLKGEDFEISLKSASEVMGNTYKADWLSLDKVGNMIYFFNSKMKDNVYYINRDTVKDRDGDSKKPILLGLFTAEDELELVIPSN